MKSKIRILHLEDDPNDAELIKLTLVDGGVDCDITLAKSRDEFLKVIEQDKFDLILTDFSIPSFDGLSALQIAKEKYPDVPIIVVSGTIGEEFAIEILRKGAMDYVLKDRLSKLIPSIERSLSEVKERAEHKKAEEALKDSEQRFRAIFDNAVDGILIADVENKTFHSGNSMICKMLGYSEEEIKNLSVTDIHPKERLNCVIEQFKKQANGEITLAPDIPVKRKDGSVFYADINSFPITLAEKTYLVGIFRDITNQEQAKEDLLREKAFTETALNTLSDIFFVFDMSGKFLRWNKTVNTILGYTNEEISKMEPADFFSGDDVQRVTESIGKVMKEGNASVEASFVTKDNKRIPYEIFGSLLKDTGGNCIGICGVGRDITDRKKFEDELRKRQEELKNRVVELEDFYNMSVGRELKMKELKEEIESLKDELARYRKDKDI